MSGNELLASEENGSSVPAIGNGQATSPATPDPVDHSEQVPSSSRTLKDLFRPPQNLAAMRERLFQVQDTIELQVDEFERYWPYVDNVWVRQHRAGTDRTGRYTTDYFACRLQRPTYTPKASDTPRPDGKPVRKKQIREGGTCQMRLKTVRFDGGYSSYTITRVGEHAHHTHDLDHLDKIKRTTVLMDIARSEVVKGYMPASVFTLMSEDMEKLAAAGGRYLNRNDVRNASQAWRQAHRDPLRVHDGYKYDHGNGIIRKDDEPSSGLTSGHPQIADAPNADVSTLPHNTLHFHMASRNFLERYLPPVDLNPPERDLPHVTLTYATSMDSSLALAPGLQTILSGPESKAMTHYLRSKHDAILVGVGTAVADDPGLNCRLEGVGGYGGLGWDGQPRPVIVDPGARWFITPDSRILKTVQEGKGRGPWIIMAPGFAMDPNRIELLKYYGGRYLGLKDFDKKWRLSWDAILKALAAEGIRSVMIEGGGTVINELLQPEHASMISSVVVTMAPTYLGKGGLVVSPIGRLDQTGRPKAVIRFEDVNWQQLGEDVVMCGKPKIDASTGPDSMAPRFGTFP
ncbi:2,5-diamino-6-(ribosylamino)-4(3H)-pyrimidinone 5'-phosphate reductase [Hypocenomyce scalaris]|nr:2,5-diamino-6-(ribosylamino)-4(3H)-pyrimidinone 5'-phosphate reductase [Hypocenomyce scalaris]